MSVCLSVLQSGVSTRLFHVIFAAAKLLASIVSERHVLARPTAERTRSDRVRPAARPSVGSVGAARQAMPRWEWGLISLDRRHY